MHSPKKTPARFAMALLPTLLALDAESQETVREEEPPQALETVTVTAQRREEQAQQVPAPISVFSATDLERKLVGRTASEIADFIPNVSAATLSSHIQPRWWIRGIGAPDPAATVVNPIGIYIDDVYVNAKDAAGFPLFDLERVEVLRGPQGTLYGKNTTAGAISFISKKPTFEPEGFAKLDLGNYDSRVFETAVSGALDSAKRIAGRAAFHQETRDGYYKDSIQGDGGMRDTAGRFQLLVQASDNLDALLRLHIRELKSDEAIGSPLGIRPGYTNDYGLVLKPNERDVANNAPNEDILRHAGTSLTLNWALDDLELTSITAFEDVKRAGLKDNDGTLLDLSRDYTAQGSRQWSQEFRLASPKDQTLSWIAGAHWFHEQVDYARTRAVLPGAPTAQTWNGILVDQSTESYALFGSTTWNVSPRFSLTTGLRYTLEQKDIDLNRRSRSGVTFNDNNHWWNERAVNTPLRVIATQEEEKNWGAFSYDITPEYRLNDNARVYLRIARGFRSGGYNGTAATQSNVAVIDPEYLTAYELGIKSEWFDSRLNFNASAFYYDYDDIQINTTRPSELGTVSTLTNGAKARVTGAEFEIAALPFEHLYLNATLGLLDTEYLEYEAADADYTGNEFGRAPHVTGSLGIEYRIPLAVGGEVVLGTDWRSSSHFYFSNTEQNEPLQEQDAYVTGSARIAYVTPDKGTTTSLYVRNLTDEDYQTAVNAGGNGALSQNLGAPRTFGLSVTTRF